MLKKLHVGLVKIEDKGGGRARAFCRFMLTDIFGRERQWKAILHFDYQVGAVGIDMGPDAEDPDAEQLEAMRQAFTDLGVTVGEDLGYGRADQKFSMD